jgi:hypothetical protein
LVFHASCTPRKRFRFGKFSESIWHIANRSCYGHGRLLLSHGASWILNRACICIWMYQ